MCYFTDTNRLAVESNIYTYSLLQYRHSQILEEVLNIGLLVYFPNSRRLEFVYPERLLRLKFAYPNVPDKTIRAYFKSFTEKIAALNQQPELYADFSLEKSLKDFAETELIPIDSSALQFGSTKRGLLYTNDPQKLLNDLYNLYFSVFDHNTNIIERLDETHLLRRYKKLIQQFNQDIFECNSHKLQLDFVINPTDTKEFKFDIAWQGDTLNLVKPISFDVKKYETLNNKAYRYYGQFIDLQDFAVQRSYRFDLLLAKPKNRELFKYYDNAVKLLEKPKQVKLIEEGDLKDYSVKTLEAISN